VVSKSKAQPWYKPFTWLYIIIGAGGVFALLALCWFAMDMLSLFADTPSFHEVPFLDLLSLIIAPIGVGAIAIGVIIMGTQLMRKRFKAGRLVIIGGVLQLILAAIIPIVVF